MPRPLYPHLILEINVKDLFHYVILINYVIDLYWVLSLPYCSNVFSTVYRKSVLYSQKKKAASLLSAHASLTYSSNSPLCF